MGGGRARQFEWGARHGRPQVVHDRVVTTANLISVLRLLGLPVFVWLMLGPQAYGAALAVLAAVGATDWVDGYVARRFDQVTRLGKALDPLIDRALVITAGLTLLLAGMLPWWLVALVAGRDLVLVLGAAIVFRGIPTIPVTRIGKTATAALLLALPGLLLGHMDWRGASAVLVGSWVVAVLGVAAYYVAAGQYVRALLKRPPSAV